MNLLDMISTSVLGALGCNMDSFLRYFPAADTMYDIFVALAIGLILLNWVWNVFKNFGLVAGLEAEDPIKLSIRSVLFIFLAFFSKDIVNIALDIGGTPYNWVLTSELPPLSFANFNSVIVTIFGVVANGSVALIALILLSNSLLDEVLDKIKPDKTDFMQRIIDPQNKKIYSFDIKYTDWVFCSNRRELLNEA